MGEFGGGEIGGGGREGVSGGLGVSEKELCCSSLQEERTLFVSNNSLCVRRENKKTPHTLHYTTTANHARNESTNWYKVGIAY